MWQYYLSLLLKLTFSDCGNEGQFKLHYSSYSSCNSLSNVKQLVLLFMIALIFYWNAFITTLQLRDNDSFLNPM